MLIRGLGQRLSQVAAGAVLTRGAGQGGALGVLQDALEGSAQR